MTRLPNQPPLPTPEPNWKFRWGWVFIPLTLVLLTWFVSGITPTMSFPDISEAIGVVQENNFVMFTALAAGLIGITIFIRILKRK